MNLQMDRVIVWVVQVNVRVVRVIVRVVQVTEGVQVRLEVVCVVCYYTGL